MSDGEGLKGAGTDKGQNRSCVAQAVTREFSKLLEMKEVSGLLNSIFSWEDCYVYYTFFLK